MSKYSRQMDNLVAASLPAPPTVRDFIQCLQEFRACEGNREQPENALFGNLFDQKESMPKPKGSEKNQQIGAKIAVDFQYSTRCHNAQQ